MPERRCSPLRSLRAARRAAPIPARQPPWRRAALPLRRLCLAAPASLRLLPFPGRARYALRDARWHPPRAERLAAPGYERVRPLPGAAPPLVACLMRDVARTSATGFGRFATSARAHARDGAAVINKGVPKAPVKVASVNVSLRSVGALNKGSLVEHDWLSRLAPQTFRLRGGRYAVAPLAFRQIVSARIPAIASAPVLGSGTRFMDAVDARPNVTLSGVPSDKTPVSVPDKAVMSPSGKLKALPNMVTIDWSLATTPEKVPPKMLIRPSPSVATAAVTLSPVTVPPCNSASPPIVSEWMEPPKTVTRDCSSLAIPKLIIPPDTVRVAESVTVMPPWEPPVTVAMESPLNSPE